MSQLAHLSVLFNEISSCSAVQQDERGASIASSLSVAAMMENKAEPCAQQAQTHTNNVIIILAKYIPNGGSKHESVWVACGRFCGSFSSAHKPLFLRLLNGT